MSADTELKPVSILSNIEKLNYLKINSDHTINELDNEKQKPLTLYDVMKTEYGTHYSKFLNTACVNKISVIKHVHKNGVCLNGPKHFINNTMPQIVILKESKNLINIF